MTITKLGHCCLLIEVGEVTILTDPGAWTTAQTEVRGLSAVLVTHEHADHLHIDSLKVVLENNPGAVVYTNAAVGKLLAEAGVVYTLVPSGETISVSGVAVKAYEQDHADVYDTIPVVVNTGFLVGGSLFYPGDAFIEPSEPVEVLALPVAGPWLDIRDALEYCKKLKPKVAFPVHDGFLKFGGPFYNIPKISLAGTGIEFHLLEAGQSLEV